MTPEQPPPAEPAGRVFVGRKPELCELRAGLERALAGRRHGAHYCIGAALARLMGRVALKELAAHLGDAHVDVERGRRLRAPVSRGWESLPIAVRGADRTPALRAR